MQRVRTLRRTPWGRFGLHYAGMVAVMFVGMGVLYMPLIWASEAIGADTGAWRVESPELVIALMAVSMTVPMVAWMRFRGHAWAPTTEMAASMLIPSAFVAAMPVLSLTSDIGAMLTLEHVLMLPAMLAAMLWRREEYTGCQTAREAVPA